MLAHTDQIFIRAIAGIPSVLEIDKFFSAISQKSIAEEEFRR